MTEPRAASVLGKGVAVHPWNAPFSGASDLCGAMVMRGSGGDQCGLPRDHPAHRGERPAALELTRYDFAYRIQSQRDEREFGVLLFMGYGYYLICPAAATLYVGNPMAGDLLDCNIGEECDWRDDVHAQAEELIRNGKC